LFRALAFVAVSYGAVRGGHADAVIGHFKDALYAGLDLR